MEKILIGYKYYVSEQKDYEMFLAGQE